MNRDPIINAINHGIRGDIQFNLDNERYRAVLILTYSAMDAMAFLSMPETQTEVARKDFMEWTSRYVRFSGSYQLTGEDLYGARCGLLHSYTSHSKLSRAGKCRQLIYVHKSAREPVIPYRGKLPIVLVSLTALVEALFWRIDAFLPRLFADTKKVAIAERRVRKLMVYEEASGDDVRLSGFRHGL